MHGPGRTRLLRSVRDGSASYDPDRKLYTNRIHRDDCAGAIRAVLEADAAPGILIGVDDHPVEYGELLHYLAEQLGAPPPKHEPTPPDSRRARTNKRCRNALLRQLGWEPQYPTYREGYAPLIRELLAN